jgi:glucarate dehydratase
VTRDSAVVEVRLTPVAFPEPPLRNAAGVHGPVVARLMIEVITQSGAVGLGETFGDPAMLTAASAAVPAVRGCDVFDTVDLARRLGVDVFTDGQADLDAGTGAPQMGSFAGRGPVRLYSALEVAFLDAQGHLLGRPVHQLLGGKLRDEVDFCGYLFYKFAAHPDDGPDRWGEVLDPESMVGLAHRFVDDHGFGSLKLKGGVLSPDDEVETLRLLADAFPGVGLRIDPNAAWTVPTSIDVARRVGDIVEYLEDPTPGLDGMAEVAAASAVPLATNMVVTSFQQLEGCLERGAAGIILGDHHFWGGLRATQHLGALAATMGLSLSMHSNSHLGVSLAAMVQTAAVLPGLRYSCDTHYPWLTTDVVADPPTIKGGSVVVGDAPGLGVTLDPDAMARGQALWRANADVSRDDAAAMRRYQPDWSDRRPRW